MDEQKDCVVVPVAFGRLGASHGTVRIGASIDRGKMELAIADSLFSGGKLGTVLLRDPNARADIAGQSLMDCAATDKLEGVAKVGGYKVTRKAFTVSLRFAESEVDVARVVQFASSRGSVILRRVDEGSET